MNGHGHAIGARTPEYRSWRAMKARCLNPNDPCWATYGGRGITICDAWCESFERFLADMGPRPGGHSLDRIDNDRGYGPDNCRWATASEQAANRRKRVRTHCYKGHPRDEWMSATHCRICEIQRRRERDAA